MPRGTARWQPRRPLGIVPSQVPAWGRARDPLAPGVIPPPASAGGAQGRGRAPSSC